MKMLTFIPPQREVDFRKGFLNSHSESTYGWIFNKQTDDNGYVTPN
jgi:hypothetical protein